MKSHCQIIISATTRKEANEISDILIKKRLIAGSLITDGLSKYWWKRKIVKKKYFNISAWSLMKNKNKIISEIEKIHSDKCPIIAFKQINGNKKFLNWIEKSVII